MPMVRLQGNDRQPGESILMTLPKWIERSKDHFNLPQDIDRWYQALEIAWEALSEIDPPMNTSDHGCWKIAREAMRRIEEMG